jgi:predicted O-methyltransferase YrrM
VTDRGTPADPVHRYVLDHTRAESPVRERLRAATARLPSAGMQISPSEGAFLAWLVTAIRAKDALEIGTFTGYSALCVAEALPVDGRLVACDVSREWTDIARRFWEQAGIASKIELRLGPAAPTLEELAREGRSFDFAFIDADKANYSLYYERCLELLRPGGVIVIDNVLWAGRVADPTVDDEKTRAISDLNDRLLSDGRVDFSLLAAFDGLALVRKRETS